MRHCAKNVHYLPPLLFIVISITFIITYSVAVHLKHVYPFWPYISDTGTLPPESCIFSFCLNFTCFILLIIIYIRHRQVSAFSKLRPYVRITRGWNITASLFGFFGMIGLAVVASFQETNSFLVHILGALVCFVFSTVYFFFHCIFTYKMKYVSKLIFWLRVLFTCVNVITFITIFAPVKAAMDKFKGDNVLLWTPKEGGHSLHVLSTASEWVLVVSFGLYVCTFFGEFKKFEVTSPEIRFREMFVEEKEESKVEEEIKAGVSNWV